MRARVDRQRLAEGLALCLGSIDARSTIPQLACVLLRPESDGVLCLATTDLNMSTAHRVQSDVAHDDVPVCVDAKKIYDVVHGLNATHVTIETDASHSLAEGRIAISTGRAATYRLPTLPARDFPELFAAPRDMQAIDTAALASVLGRAAHTMCVDTTKHPLEGVQIDADGTECNVYSADGKMGGWVSVPMSLLLAAHLPARGVGLLRSVLAEMSEAEIGKANERLFVRGGGTTIGIRLLDEHPFPPVRHHIPKALGAVAIERAALVRAAKLMVSTGAADGVSLDLILHLGVRTLFLHATGKTEADERMDVTRKGGEPYSVALNARCVLAALAAHSDDDVRIETGSRRLIQQGTLPPRLEESNVVFRSSAGVSLVAPLDRFRSNVAYHGPTDDDLPPVEAPLAPAAAKKSRAKKAGPAATTIEQDATEPQEAPCPAPAPVPERVTAPSSATVPVPTISPSAVTTTSSPATAPATTPIPTETTIQTTMEISASGPAGEPAAAPAPTAPADLIERAEGLGRIDRDAKRDMAKSANKVAALVGVQGLALAQEQREELAVAYWRGYREDA